MTSDPLCNDRVQKTLLPGIIKLQDKICRSFISISIENRTRKVYLKKENLTSIVHPKIQPRIPNAIKSIKDSFGSRTKSFFKHRVGTGEITVRVKLRRLQRIRLKRFPLRKDIFNRLEDLAGLAVRVGRNKHRKLPSIYILFHE